VSELADIGTADRLSVTLVFALLFHAVVVLGVTFSYDDPSKDETIPTLDVILVQQRSEESPKEADYLAQVSQMGGGTSPDKVRPQSPVSGQIPKPERGLAPQPVMPSVPKPQPKTPPKVLTRDKSVAKVIREETRKPTPDLPKPSAKELIQRSMELARLEAEIGRDLQAYARRPRRKFISANTKEYEFATYMQAWVSKVERIGNLNYPDEARRRQLAGNLVLTVAIDRDGNIDKIDIIQPSGFKILDEAAIRIVRMGAPYSELPDNIRDKVDILHITRTWQFLPGNILKHK
jgi:protein TonB